MEPVYEIRHTITQEEYLYMAKHPHGKDAAKNRKRGIRLRIIGCAISLLLVVMGLWQREYFLFLCGFSFLALFLARLFLLENIVLKKQYRMLLNAQPDGVWTRTFLFYDDALRITEGRTESKYSYSEIATVSDDERYVLLWLNGENMVLRIPKAALQDIGAFRSFVSGRMADSLAQP